MAGGYLVYLAYGLFRDRGQTDTAMSPAARILFIALFVVSAAGILVYAVHVWRDSKRDDDRQPPRDDQNSMK